MTFCNISSLSLSHLPRVKTRSTKCHTVFSSVGFGARFADGVVESGHCCSGGKTSEPPPMALIKRVKDETKANTFTLYQLH